MIRVSTLQNVLEIPETQDFILNGRGDHAAWQNAPRFEMPSRDPYGTPMGYETSCKILWSRAGIYFFIDAGDKRLTCTGLPDRADLWKEDVLEVFLWPYSKHAYYLEYEVSPMGSELPLLTTAHGEEYMGSFPTRYQGGRQPRKAVSVRGGPQTPGASVTGWSAEIFIPSFLLYPMPNIHLMPGVEWRMNVFRIDYDEDRPQYFCLHDGGHSYHNIHAYPTFRFI
jgi:hypothetical protein